jgi:hypothetical protein
MESPPKAGAALARTWNEWRDCGSIKVMALVFKRVAKN